MFHVITPMARYENIPKLIHILKEHNITWHVITDDDNDTPISFQEPWIHHYLCPNKNVRFWQRCNYSINWFIETHDFSPEDYYCILNDDDSYEKDFFKNLSNKIQEFASQEEDEIKLVIVSMKRGHHVPSGLPFVKQHPTNTLYAKPESMKACEVGAEQFFLKGNCWKQHRIPLDAYACGDGKLIEELVRRYKTFYVPDLYVLFNYLESGRWDKEEE